MGSKRKWRKKEQNKQQEGVKGVRFLHLQQNCASAPVPDCEDSFFTKEEMRAVRGDQSLGTDIGCRTCHSGEELAEVLQEVSTKRIRRLESAILPLRG